MPHRNSSTLFQPGEVCGAYITVLWMRKTKDF